MGFRKFPVPLQKISYKSENLSATIVILLLKGDFKMKEKDFYREKIIEMVQNVDNVEWLRFIHRMIKNLIG